jgi:hypothetical protein
VNYFLPYDEEGEEVERVYGKAYKSWWGFYSQWKQGQPFDPNLYEPDWREALIEGSKSLPPTSDALDFVRAVLRVKRKAEAAAKANNGTCPKCGHVGNFIRMALCCPTHGMFGGI